MRYLLYGLGLVLGTAIIACSTASNSLEEYDYFLPSASQRNEGIVHKYYVHFDTKENNTTATSIEYRFFQFIDDQSLKIKYFDPAFQPTRSRLFALNPNALILESEEFYSRNDTQFQTIIQPTFLDLSQSGKSLEILNNTKKRKRVQTGLRDTVIAEGPAIIVEGLIMTHDTKETNEAKVTAKYRDVYLKGIGLFTSNIRSSNETYQIELVEQIPRTKFQEMANHDIKRVGYIDPAKSLFKATDFQLCSSANRIVDYYNGIPVAGYRGDKQTLRERLLKEVDPEYLFQESGYLTFRFVINCKGKAGWFVTEMADLDYQKIVFKKETINHLGKIVADLDYWQATVRRGEVRDAYAYLTFKLRNGKIIEILP